MTSFLLKLLAIASMFIDHVGVIFFPDEIFFRMVGRIAFPIFAWQITVGYKNSTNIKNYFLRLLFFALICQVPFSIAFQTLSLNIFFTLLMGLLSIKFYNHAKNKYLGFLFSMFMIMLGQAIDVDYGAYGVAVIFLLHVFQNKRIWLVASFAVITLIFSAVYFVPVQIFSLLALLPIFIYNGRQGPRFKYLFYIFYPGHLLLLYLLKLIIDPSANIIR